MCSDAAHPTFEACEARPPSKDAAPSNALQRSFKGKEGAYTCSEVPNAPTYTSRIANTISASLRHTASTVGMSNFTVQVQKTSLSTPVIYKPTHTTDSASWTRFKSYITHYY
jgi:hypothetical protein